MSSRATEFRLLTLAACTAVLLPRLAHRGMFFDGVTYASIARNLAEGRGRFWEPSYTATLYPAFHEHPPLAFWLQSLWFRVLGDHWFVERAYCAAAAVAIASLIAVIWRAVQADARERSERGGDVRSERGNNVPGDNAWLPIAFWIAPPVVSWTIVGNLLETTVSVFVTAAVAAIAVARRGSIGALAGGAVSGLCVAGAVLSKGPVGFSPLAAPLILAILPDRRADAASAGGRRERARASDSERGWGPASIGWSAAAQWATVGLCALALFAIPSARDSLSMYIDQQVMTALSGQREVSGSPITIVVELLQGVWLPMVLAVAIIAAAARGWVSPSMRDRRIAIAFTLIGLAGTLPMLVSPKQTGHYLMPAVPFYAIGAAALAARTMDRLAARVARSGAGAAVKMLAGTLAVGAVAAIWLPALERDPARLAALDRLAPLAPRGETIGICPSANGDWVLHAWLQRRFLISLDAARPHVHPWFLKSTDEATACPPATCVPASDPAHELVLMRCRP